MPQPGQRGGQQPAIANPQTGQHPGGSPGGPRGPEVARGPFVVPHGAQAATRPGGGNVYTHSDGRRWETGGNGQLTHFSRPGMDAHFADNGRLASAHIVRPDHSEMFVNRGLHGERHVEVVRPDHSRVVAFGSHHGYLERPMQRPGYLSRTYVIEGRSHVVVYRDFSFRGMVYHRYVPPVYYAPGFYAWAYRPWSAPVAYAWTWNADPWYGYYGAYLAPMPVYPSAALWLTDFLLAQNLRMAYQNQQDALAGQAPPAMPQEVAFSPEVKQAIAEEVRAQLAAQQNAAAAPPAAGYGAAPVPVNDIPAWQDPAHRMFVAANGVDVLTITGQTCAITPGDVLFRSGETLDNGNRVAAMVLQTKPGDCPVNSAVQVDVATLQDWHNQFQDHIQSGLQVLASNQGQGGLPAGPAANPRATADGMASADPSVVADLQKQLQDANQAEADAAQAAKPPTNP
jgi:hypothetical protein